MLAKSRLLTCQPRRSLHLSVILMLMCLLGAVVYDVHMVLIAVDAVVLLPHLPAASDIFVGVSTCLLLIRIKLYMPIVDFVGCCILQ